MLQLHSASDCRQGAIDFSCGSITVCEGKVHRRISSVYNSRRDYQDHSYHSFHCLIPCSIALHLFSVRLLANTRLYKAIGACTIVYDTDLQWGRAVTSMSVTSLWWYVTGSEKIRHIAHSMKFEFALFLKTSTIELTYLLVWHRSRASLYSRSHYKHRKREITVRRRCYVRV